ncbi:uncharacterized protein LOC124929668 [Impatiens glandulifera]|uniref:uncharacterized protein LOC124929668 n=1 Tax=Impatiens glandulifera TaxID=253017 RepID=UPI001FB079BE|nr:uncharacterized protein LOC124929668 [Impatiens glandulifera]
MADKYYNNTCKEGHELQLKSTRDDNHSFNYFFECDGCKEEGFGSRYCCYSTGTCKYDLHEKCRNPSLTIQNPPHFPGRNFYFLQLPSASSQSSFCVACGKQISGFLYRSEYMSGLDLHPCCLTNLPLNISFAGANFNLKYYVVGGSEACFRCHKTTLYVPGTNIQGPGGWSYESACRAYWCHVYCMGEFRMDIIRDILLLMEKEGVSWSKNNLRRIALKLLSAANTVAGAILGQLGDPTDALLEMTGSG